MSVGSPQGRGPLSWERAIPRPDRAWGSLGHAVLPQGLLGSHLQEAVTNVFWNSLQLTHSPLSVGPQTPPTWGWPAPRGSFSPEREGPSVSRPAARAAWCPPQQAGRVRRTRPPASHIPPRGGPRLARGRAQPRSQSWWWEDGHALRWEQPCWPGLPAPRPCSWGRQVEGMPGSVLRMRRVRGCAGPRNTGPRVPGPLGAEGNRVGQWGR